MAHTPISKTPVQSPSGHVVSQQKPLPVSPQVIKPSAPSGPVSAAATGKVAGRYMGAAFDTQDVIKFQRWLNIETGTGAGSPYEVIQPWSGWLRGDSVSTYHLKIQISYLNACTLYIESSTTPEGPWTTVLSYTEQTDVMAVISSEGGSAKFSSYVRWRISGNAPYQICFQLEAVPGASVASYIGSPRRL